MFLSARRRWGTTICFCKFGFVDDLALCNFRIPTRARTIGVWNGREAFVVVTSSYAGGLVRGECEVPLPVAMEQSPNLLEVP